MTDLNYFSINVLIGQVMVYVIDYLNKHFPERTESKVRFWVSVLTCLAIGCVLNLDFLKFGSTDQMLESFLTIWFSAQAAYKTYYEGSQMQYKIRKPILPVENEKGI